jgi:hypothetical protein
LGSVTFNPPKAQRHSLAEAAAAGEGIAEAGRALEQVADTMRAQERKNKIGELNNVALDELKRMEEELSTGTVTGPDGTTRKMSYEEASRAADARAGLIKEQLLQGVNDKVVRQAVELDYDRMSILTRAGVRSDLAKLRGKENQDVYLSQKTALVDRVADEADPRKKALLQSMLLQHIAGAAATGIISDPRAQLQEARHMIAVREMERQIRIEPDKALARLREKDVDPLLNETDVKKLLSTARATVSAREAEVSRARAAETRALKQYREGIGNEFVQRLEKNELDTTSVLDSDLAPTGENSKEHWVKMIKQKAKDETAAPPNGGPMAVDLLRNIYLPEGHPEKITNMNQIERYYYAEDRTQRISFTDLTRLRKEFEGARSEAGSRLGSVKNGFVEGVKDLIAPKGPLGQVLQPGGGEAMYRFERYVDEQVQKKRDKKEDPYSLFDPHSRDYLGSPETVKMFVPKRRQSQVERALGREDLPLRKGSLNAEDLQPGTIYTLPDGRRGEWDGIAFNIVGGGAVSVPLVTREESTLRQTVVP